MQDVLLLVVLIAVHVLDSILLMNRMFNPVDEMDVGEMVKMLAEIRKLRDVPWAEYGFAPAARNVTLEAQLPELKVIAHIADCLHTALMGKELDVSQHLVNLSKLGHILFAAYRRNGTGFLAAQNYANLQSIVKGVFKSVWLA